LISLSLLVDAESWWSGGRWYHGRRVYNSYTMG